MKSKPSIRILIGLMSVALLGIVVIQFLWIKNAFDLKEEEFDRSVNDALASAGKNLENRYGIHYITHHLSGDSNVLNEILKQDPGFYRFMQSVGDNKAVVQGGDGMVSDSTRSELDIQDESPANNDADMPVISRTRPRKVEIHLSKNGKHSIVSVVNLNEERNGKMLVEKTVAITYPEPSADIPEPPAPPAPPALPAVKARASQLITAVQCAANDYAISTLSADKINDVIDSEQIRSALSKEFVRNNLPLNFDFATYCIDGDSLMVNRNASLHPFKDFKYKTPLLAGSFVEAKSLLLLRFPDHFKYIFASLAGMLSLSLFFTLAIVSAFAYSLHVIFRQKKLSDITSDFINNMTHELKTPLATISLTADTLGLQSVNSNSNLVSEYSGMIKNEVRKLSGHVDRILEAALLEKNGKARRREILSLKQLVEEEVRVFEPVVLQQNGIIKTTISTDAQVSANRELLRSAICNLLDNAVKYSDGAPEINISVSGKTGRVVLCVEDKGVGISKADQKMIFEKFFRAHTGNRHDVKGFGLGLSFVKDVVENLNGKLWVESEPGAGSRFYIELPTA
ncbi:MAG TPA: HAMP domain-containing sensor histidine kinase [Chitinophagales bacterium]|nr:HAMP domain-containing sensor histidine kinase [Chitinophagales bacterium]